MTANEITANLLIEIPKRFPGIRVWRNNTGAGAGISTVKQAIAAIRENRTADAIRLLSSRPIRFGIVGQADITGIVGPWGRRLEIEVKTGKDKMSDEQRAFQQMILSAGGIYLVAVDVEATLQRMGIEAAML